MLFLVELDHVRSGSPLTPEAGREFIERVIFPTLARAEELTAERKILGGGPVVGRVALRFIFEVDSAAEVDRLVTSLAIWPYAETRVTPLLAPRQRRAHVSALLAGLAATPSGSPSESS
jgi:muconolactone delta-isomerase